MTNTFISDNLELNGEYVLLIDSIGFIKLLECGSTEEIEEGNLQVIDFPLRCDKVDLFK